MFQRLLIANRGEIALRIVRACERLGITSVVAFSEADRGGPWLRQADETICVGPARAADSYLDAQAILQAAEQTGCQAIHPGYGFLSENARFAARCFQQGLTFVGPSPAAIRRMGDKIEAKRTMAAAGIPILPGSEGVLADAEEAGTVARQIGYPVLLKAAAGGGGKGMRLCRDAGELERGFAEASLEAASAFGNPGIYLEKFIGGARHVEFQVLCDAFGKAVHLGERECSIQRKHQKLIEEGPSPVVDGATRERLGAMVVRAATCAGYRNAGTLEFLRQPDGQFYFMEMNTRLQVEHAVTEMLTGVDLVVEQLKIAANQPLTLDREPIPFAGHAMEFRINAEDPAQGFRPDPGVIQDFRLPVLQMATVRLRWDSAIERGYRIGPHYDSLIGKLILHGPDRTAVLAASRVALDGLEFQGIATTVPVLRRLLDDPGFRAGEYDIGYLERTLSLMAGGPKIP